MDKHKTKQAGSRFQVGSLPQALLSRVAGVSRVQLFRRAAAFLLPFALAGAAIMPGMTQFAVSMAAACQGGYALAAALGALAGHLVFFSQASLCYIAAVIVCLTCTAVFQAAAKQSPLFLPLCATISLLFTKSAVVLGSGLGSFLLLLCESLLCGTFCYFFAQLREHSAEERMAATVSRVALLIGLLLVLAPLRIFSIISPARALGMLCVMLLSYLGGCAAGAGAGAAIGIAFDLTGAVSPFFAASYGFAGLFAGLCAKKGRMLFCITYLIANAIGSLWNITDPRAIAGLYECFIASVLFVLLPDKALLTVKKFAVPPASAPATTPESKPGKGANIASRKLKSVSSAIHELSLSLGSRFDGMGRKNDEDVSRIFDRAADSVCRKCVVAGACWDRDYVTTFGALNDVTETLRHNRYLKPTDFPPYFAARCINLNDFCAAVNEEYRALLRRRAQASRAESSRQLMQQQYEGLSGVIADVAGAMNAYPEYYPALEAKVKNIARAYASDAVAAVYSDNGRMHVEITAADREAILPDEDAFSQSVSLALGKQFLPPEDILTKDGHVLRLSEQERFLASACCAVRHKQGEEVCGDANLHFHTDDGRAVITLSDGMGSGAAAAQTAQTALTLISQFIRSGCSMVESTRAVLPALATRLEDCGFVTLDLLEINLFTGRAQLLKYGAAPSYLVQGRHVKRFSASALPAGMEQEAGEPEPAGFQLHPGDRIVMVSDGVCDATNDGWVTSILSQSARLDANELAARLMEGPGDSPHNIAHDDMTVLVVTLANNAE